MQIAAHAAAAVSPTPRSLLSRAYVAQLHLKGVQKLTASHLRAVAKLDRAYDEASAEVDARPGSLMSQAMAGAR